MKQRQKMWEVWREHARQQARMDFQKLMQDPLFVAGIMLYWGEGDSKLENGQVALGNTDPDMMRLYTSFLVKVCAVPRDRIRAFAILYPDLDETTCLNFWSKATELPKSQFTKTQFIRGRHPTKRLSHGICMARIGDRRLKEKIFVWIDLFQREYPSGVDS